MSTQQSSNLNGHNKVSHLFTSVSCTISHSYLRCFGTSKASMSLLPTNHDEFRTKQYWDSFFQKRGESAFEWYGSYEELLPVFQPHIRTEHKILHIGCGNSTFSVSLYDQGYKNVCNLDFSDVAISEMKSKYSDREQMTWEVGDMTDMVNQSDDSMDIVFDKGALDALMSVDTIDVRAKAQMMFSEIGRVLTVGGKYICVTLAETFIIKKFMDYFTGSDGSSISNWAVTVHAAQNTAPAPFIPFVIVATKLGSNVSSPVSNCNVKFLVDHMGGAKSSADNESGSAVLHRLAQLQEFHRMRFQMGKLQVGRFEPVHLWADEGPSEVPRFTIFVLDVAERAERSVAVFMVPFGRESDYQFSSQDGLTDIAQQAGCRRLLAVCCNRPHVFPPMAELQAELSPIALSLRLADMDPSVESIPFMALDADSDWETIANGISALSGAYVVEECADEERGDAVRRRLIFLQNQNFIQTEARLVLPSYGGKKSGGGKKGKAKSVSKKSTSAPTRSACDCEFDYTSLDAHHRAALVALVLCPAVINNASSSGCGGAKGGNGAGKDGKKEPTALVVGLGGGALPMCLQRYLPGLRLWACDLDPEMETIAVQHFGFRCNTRTSVLTHEGLALIETVSRNATGDRKGEASATDALPLKGLESIDGLDLLFIDADSKDASLGLSAPPPPFVTLESIQSMHSALRPGGLLLVNVVARSKPLLAAFVDRVRYVFQATGSSGSESDGGRVFSVQASSETVNVGIVAVKGGAAPVAATVFSTVSAGAGGKAKAGTDAQSKMRIEREKLLSRWLKDVNLSSDPLQLEEVLGQLREESGTAATAL